MSLRPDDPFAKRMLAIPVTTNNVLLKVTVPKRTGRKRKRGSAGPFLAEHESDPKSATSDSPYVKADTVFRSLQDNATKYTVLPVGVIDEAHRVRGELNSYYLYATANRPGLPDLQQASYNNKTMKEIRENLLPLKCGKQLLLISLQN